MKVSVVTLSFNQAPFLERCLRSVLGQTGVDLDYVVVDPGSTDGSRAVIEHHRDGLARVLLDPDDGPADGLNRGLAAATGEIFCYVNADDMLLPGALARVAAEFAARPAVDAVYGHGLVEDRRSGEVYRLPATAPMTGWRLAHGGAFLMQQASFYRTAAVRAAGGFNAANRTCWDYELLADLLLAGCRFRRIHADLAVFTLHDRSISGTGSRQEQYARDWDAVVRRLVGRPSTPGRQALARLLKWAGDPGALALRLHAAFARRRTLTNP